MGALSPPWHLGHVCLRAEPRLWPACSKQGARGRITPPHPVSCLCWLVLIWLLWLSSSVLNVLSPKCQAMWGAVPDSPKFERPAQREQDGCESTSAPAASLPTSLTGTGVGEAEQAAVAGEAGCVVGVGTRDG